MNQHTGDKGERSDGRVELVVLGDLQPERKRVEGDAKAAVIGLVPMKSARGLELLALRRTLQGPSIVIRFLRTFARLGIPLSKAELSSDDFPEVCEGRVSNA